MADAIIRCKTCKEDTEHTLLAGRTCVCSRCGDYNLAADAKKIQANIDERKSLAKFHLAKTNGLEPDQELEAVAALPYSEKGFREPSRKTKEPKEKTMNQLSEEKIAAMRAEWAALPEEQRNMFGIQRLAAKYEVSKPSIRKYLKAELKAARVAKKVAKLAARKQRKEQAGEAPGNSSPKPQSAHNNEPGSGFKALLERMVDDRINVRLQGLGLDSLDSRIAEAIKAELAGALK